MLMPFQWAILELEEARILLKHIENIGGYRNYDKMRELGLLDIYNRLREFVGVADHYEANIRYLDPSDYARTDHEHYRSGY